MPKYADAPGFAENFYRTAASCRAEQSPAPTNLLHQNSHVRCGRGCSGLFKLKCAGVQSVISSVLGNELFVVAALDDASVIQYHYDIRIHDR